MRTLLKFITLLLPWPVRRQVLRCYFDYNIHPSAKIGLSWVFPNKLIMEENTRINHFTVAINLDLLKMSAYSTIGRGNWITGFPVVSQSSHFKHQQGRRAELLLGESSSITKNHHIDCTNLVTIGRFTTIAGYNSQFLTHSIDVSENRQDSMPINIGDYVFVGTNVVILGGSKLPSHSVLGAKSLLNKAFDNEWTLYGGVPARSVQAIPKTAKYFTRKSGFVN